MNHLNHPGVITIYASNGPWMLMTFVGTIAELREALIPAIERRGTRDQA